MGNSLLLGLKSKSSFPGVLKAIHWLIGALTLILTIEVSASTRFLPLKDRKCVSLFAEYKGSIPESVLHEAYDAGIIDKKALSKGKLKVTEEKAKWERRHSGEPTRADKVGDWVSQKLLRIDESPEGKQPGIIRKPLRWTVDKSVMLANINSSRVRDLYRTVLGLSDVIRYQISKLPTGGDGRIQQIRDYLVYKIGKAETSEILGDLAEIRGPMKFFAKVSKNGSENKQYLELFDRHEQLRVLIQAEAQVHKYVLARTRWSQFQLRKIWSGGRIALANWVTHFAGSRYEYPFHFLAEGIEHTAKIAIDPKYENHPDMVYRWDAIREKVDEWHRKLYDFIPDVRERLNQYIVYRAQIRTLSMLLRNYEMMKDRWMLVYNPHFVESFVRIEWPEKFENGQFVFSEKPLEFKNRAAVLSKIAEVRGQMGMKGWFKSKRELKFNGWPRVNHFRRFIFDLEDKHSQMHRNLQIVFDQLEKLKRAGNLDGWRLRLYERLSHDLFDPFLFPTIKAINRSVATVAGAQWKFIDKQNVEYSAELQRLDEIMVKVGGEKPLPPPPKPGKISRFIAKYGRSIPIIKYRYGIIFGFLGSGLGAWQHEHIVDPAIEGFREHGHYVMQYQHVDSVLRGHALSQKTPEEFQSALQYYITAKYNLVGFHNYTLDIKSAQVVQFREYLNSHPEVREDWLRLIYFWEMQRESFETYGFKETLGTDHLRNLFAIDTYKVVELANEVSFLYSAARVENKRVLGERADTYLGFKHQNMDPVLKAKVIDWVRDVKINEFSGEFDIPFPADPVKYKNVQRLVKYYFNAISTIRSPDLTETEKRKRLDTLQIETFFSEVDGALL